MTGLNIKDFLTYGAFLQIGPDLFKVLVGPFDRHDSVNMDFFKHPTLLYKPNFWDFLNNSPDIPQKPVYSATQVYVFDREEFIDFLSTVKSQRPEVKWEKLNETQFRTQFEWSQRNFKEHKLSKVVPIAREQGVVEFSFENLLWCIQNLVQNKTFGWSYGFFENSVGVIGHTPEILAHWSPLRTVSAPSRPSAGWWSVR